VFFCRNPEEDLPLAKNGTSIEDIPSMLETTWATVYQYNNK
jgi:hypothetical protein